MSTFIFYRENNDFTDILKDKNIKKIFVQKIKFRNFLIGLANSVPEETKSYIMLKYGDDLKSWDHIRKDFSPIPYKDYLPDPNRPEKFKNVYK